MKNCDAEEEYNYHDVHTEKYPLILCEKQTVLYFCQIKSLIFKTDVFFVNDERD